jgi:hypothetical protein
MPIGGTIRRRGGSGQADVSEAGCRARKGRTGLGSRSEADWKAAVEPEAGGAEHRRPGGDGAHARSAAGRRQHRLLAAGHGTSIAGAIVDGGRFDWRTGGGSRTSPDPIRPVTAWTSSSGSGRTPAPRRPARSTCACTRASRTSTTWSATSTGRWPGRSVQPEALETHGPASLPHRPGKLAIRRAWNHGIGLGSWPVTDESGSKVAPESVQRAATPLAAPRPEDSARRLQGTSARRR